MQWSLNEEIYAFLRRQAGPQLIFGALTTGRLQGLKINHFNRRAECKVLTPAGDFSRTFFGSFHADQPSIKASHPPEEVVS